MKARKYQTPEHATAALMQEIARRKSDSVFYVGAADHMIEVPHNVARKATPALIRACRQLSDEMAACAPARKKGRRS